MATMATAISNNPTATHSIWRARACRRNETLINASQARHTDDSESVERGAFIMFSHFRQGDIRELRELNRRAVPDERLPRLLPKSFASTSGRIAVGSWRGL